MITPGSIDYGNLAFSIFNGIWAAGSLLDHNTALRDTLAERYKFIDEIKKKRVVSFSLAIPGNLTSYFYIADTDKDISGYYRIGATLVYVMNIDMTKVNNSEISLDALAEFFKEFRTKISAIFSDEHLRTHEALTLSYFTTFATIYTRYKLSKEMFIEMQGFLSKANSYVAEDNTVYENFISLIQSRNCSEGMIIRCMEEGINGEKPNNLSRSKIVQKVQP